MRALRYVLVAVALLAAPVLGVLVFVVPAWLPHEPVAPEVWVRFRPPIGEASASFPVTPDEMPEPDVSNPTRVYSYARSGGGAFQFGVSTPRAEVPPGRARAFLDSLRRSSLARPGARLLAEKSLTVEGLDAIEYTIATQHENVQIRYLVVVRGRYYYVLSSGGSAAQIADRESDTFLTSFRFEGNGAP
jgi:hypothetical protein